MQMLIRTEESKLASKTVDIKAVSAKRQPGAMAAGLGCFGLIPREFQFLGKLEFAILDDVAAHDLQGRIAIGVE